MIDRQPYYARAGSVSAAMDDVSDVKFCRDCRHAQRDDIGVLARHGVCLHQLAEITDLVFGVKYHRYMGVMRLRPDQTTSEVTCGPAGAWWEPRDG